MEPIHWVLILSSDLKDGGNVFIDEKNRERDRRGYSKEYKTISDRGFHKIEDGDTLYVSTHGYSSKRTGRSAGEIVKGRNDLNASDFYEWLVAKNLPNRKFKLKIFACFSAGRTDNDGNLQERLDKTFAGKLSALMSRSHSRVTVYGYINELQFSNLLGAYKSGGHLPGTDLQRPASQSSVVFHSDGQQELRWM